ncbi:efflux RND transporter permease subunit [Sphingomonas oligoaromativorans]|uniref:efflux RND transporter permease subunit n=1 Tax=Sphingomonas oligoaromativorans TaxID=575322 RepID=UPI00141EA839|nr:efflux RND transporter permease subunit [Sphingomonas oligoaromativorans]NIJ33177.1 multidrug efflux pump subunit AcrB [Sphingomonas oligoaromativorans]
MRNISAWSIRNPVPSLVLFAALTLAGIIAFMRMDVNNNPDISFPGVNVDISQPGAAPTELETQVTQRVEAAVRGISGVDEIQSTITEGSSSTFVQFTIGTPVDRAVNDVREAVSRIRSDLPDGILEPQVSRVDIDGDPIAFMSVESTGMTLEQLSWYVDNTIARRLLSISGMAQVERSGGVTREIRVVLDPARMQAQGVTASQVNAQLMAMNLNAAGGRAEIAGAEQSVRVLGNAKDAYALSQKQIQISAGRMIKLADIATVKDSYAEQRKLAKMNDRQVLSFDLQKAKGYSDVTVYDEAMKALKQIEKDNPRVHFTQLYASVDYTKMQYKSAIHAMIEGAVLAVVVVFFFLRDWRATVISALAIPLSAIPTFWAMDLLGFTLNGMTLLALSLVAGVLVDDAIVEIENIVRHMRMGKTAYQAAIDAADEIGLAVVATTFSIVAVFLPVGLMPGVAGQFFKNFGLTVVAAVLMSLAVARLVTPMVAAYFLEAHGAQEHGESWMMRRYMKVLRWSLKHRWWTMAGGAAALVATVFSFATLSFQFQPPLNFDFSQVKIQLVPGATLEQTTAVADKTAALVRQQPEVAAAFESIRVGNATIFITLRKDRKRTSIQFERDLAPVLNKIADARINFQSQSGGGGRDISLLLASDDPDKLEDAANKVVAQMKGISEIVAPRVEGDLPRPELIIKPRFDLAADMGVSTQALSTAIRIATLGDIDQNVAKFSLSDRQIPIRVVINENSRRDLSTIQNLPVPTTRGGSVPLRVVADIGFGEGPSQIRRYNQERRLLISADLAPGVVAGDAMKKIYALPAVAHLPDGVERPNYGDAKWQAEMITNFVIALASGILLVFAVLVLLYKRVVPPFVNLSSLLLAPLGGALALHIAGMADSLPVLIGVLMLLGIVAKNSILLIDFAIEEMARGTPKFEAIMEAGHKRAQPIIMTTVAMVAGMIPTALSISGDGSWNQPMAVTVIGGLICSTMLTLVIVPAAFSLADGFERRIGPWARRVFTTGGQHGHGQATGPHPINVSQAAE